MKNNSSYLLFDSMALQTIVYWRSALRAPTITLKLSNGTLECLNRVELLNIYIIIGFLAF